MKVIPGMMRSRVPISPTLPDTLKGNLSMVDVEVVIRIPADSEDRLVSPVGENPSL